MANRDEFDVCVVIGAGAGGGVMIKELTAAGFRVVALERGPHLQTSQFTDDELAIVVHDTLFSRDQLETSRREEASPTRTGRFNWLADDGYRAVAIDLPGYAGRRTPAWILPGARHPAYLDQPDLFHEALIEFLVTLGAAAEP